jgi:hypothetical protein
MSARRWLIVVAVVGTWLGLAVHADRLRALGSLHVQRAA